MRVISGLLMVSILLVGSGCASRPDWIEATLVTVDVSGVWSGDAATLAPYTLSFVLELTQEGSKVTGSIRPSGFLGQYGGPVEGRVTGDRFQFSHLQRPIRGEATVDGDAMTGQLVGQGVGEFRLRRVERSVPTRPQPQ